MELCLLLCLQLCLYWWCLSIKLKYQCIKVRQRTARYPFAHNVYTCCFFFMLHFLYTASFQCCTFLCSNLFMLQFFVCYTFYLLHYFMLPSQIAMFSFCILLLLCSSHVETFFLQHFVHLAQFPEVQLWSPQTSKMESFTIIWILENIDNERKLENTTENRPYTQHPELVSLFDIP